MRPTAGLRPTTGLRRTAGLRRAVPRFDTPHVEDVLFKPDGVAAGLSKGKFVVDMSSISPVATKDFAKRINALGC